MGQCGKRGEEEGVGKAGELGSQDPGGGKERVLPGEECGRVRPTDWTHVPARRCPGRQGVVPFGVREENWGGGVKNKEEEDEDRSGQNRNRQPRGSTHEIRGKFPIGGSCGLRDSTGGWRRAWEGQPCPAGLGDRGPCSLLTRGPGGSECWPRGRRGVALRRCPEATAGLPGVADSVPAGGSVGKRRWENPGAAAGTGQKPREGGEEEQMKEDGKAARKRGKKQFCNSRSGPVPAL